LKNGKCLTRKIWAGTDKKFIFKQVPVVINSEFVFMQSLPEGAKHFFDQTFEEGVKHFFGGTFEDGNKQIDETCYANQIVLVESIDPTDSHPANAGMFEVDPYLANADDVFAEDWFEVNP